MVKELVLLLAKPFVRVPWRTVDRKQHTRWRRITCLREDIDGVLRARIAARRRSLPASAGDVLSLLIESRDERGEPLTDPEVCDQLLTLLVAGHETTATALAWVFHHLLGRPPLLTKLRAEIGAERSDCATDAPYLDATIKETLRLRPVFAVVGRMLAEPTRIGRFDLPSGIVAAPCIYLVHRRPEVWPAPDDFEPKRFLSGRSTPYEFMPFGGGSRRCLGMAFALYEMRTILARVLARAELRAAPSGRVEAVRRSITFAPSGGVPVIMDNRV